MAPHMSFILDNDFCSLLCEQKRAKDSWYFYFNKNVIYSN